MPYFGPDKNPILIFIAFFIFIGAPAEARNGAHEANTAAS